MVGYLAQEFVSEFVGSVRRKTCGSKYEFGEFS